MLADESRTIQDLFKEMVETDHAKLLQEIFPTSERGDKAHVFIASSAREMLNKAENVTSYFKQSIYMLLSSCINELQGFLTGHSYAVIR